MTSVSLSCTKKERAELDKRQEIRGFKSLSEYIRYLVVLGTLVEEAIDGQPLNVESMANAVFTTGDKLMEIGAKHVLQAESAEGFREWRKVNPETQRLITGRVLRTKS
jgi:hypothetical protein